MSQTRVIAVLAMIVLGCAPAAAETLHHSMSPRMLRDVLTDGDAAFTPDLSTGDAVLRSAEPPNPVSAAAHKFNVQAWLARPAMPYEIFFYECDGAAFADPAGLDSACLSFEYRAYASVPASSEDAEIANRWNDVYHFGKAWRDELGGIALQMNVVVDGGVTAKNLQATHRRWRLTLGAFSEYLKAYQP
ncbi:MAG: YbjN domain-containing protein [Paracoccaceae bacterium]